MQVVIDVPDTDLDFIKSELCLQKETIQEGISRIIITEIKNRRFLIELKK